MSFKVLGKVLEFFVQKGVRTLELICCKDRADQSLFIVTHAQQNPCKKAQKSLTRG